MSNFREHKQPKIFEYRNYTSPDFLNNTYQSFLPKGEMNLNDNARKLIESKKPKDEQFIEIVLEREESL